VADDGGVVGDRERDFKAQEERRRAEVMALPTVAVTHHATLTPATDGDVLVTASIGPGGEAVAVWSSADGERALTANTTQPGWATFPNARATQPTPARVTRHGGSDPVRVVELGDLALAHVTVQSLPHGRVLVVGLRCHWRAESGAERNAAVHDADGRLVVEQTLGDGIEHVLTTAGGAVWVGYFDEGVFGNYGWGGTSSPEPVGAAGLIRFTADLQVDWRFPYEGHPWGTIADCYALNVDGETAWTCYYTNFPLVRIDDNVMTGWRNTLASGVKAIVVGERKVGLFGGYGADRDRLLVASLGESGLTALGEYRLVQPDGSPLPAARIVARGPDLHLLAGPQWYRLSLADLS
jgi:hypothetical protein